MNWKVKFLSIGAVCLIWLTSPGSLRADTFTYTGNNYDNCSGTYAVGATTNCAAPYSIILTFETTLTGAALENLTFGTGGNGFIYPSVSSFQISDGGGVSIYSTDSGLSVNSFDIGTDGSGNIKIWVITFSRILGSSFAVVAGTQGAVGGGQLDHSSTATILGFGSGVTTQTAAQTGTWVREGGAGGTTAVPEPSTLSLLATGLSSLGIVGIVGIRRKRSKSAGRRAKTIQPRKR